MVHREKHSLMYFPRFHILGKIAIHDDASKKVTEPVLPHLAKEIQKDLFA